MSISAYIMGTVIGRETGDRFKVETGDIVVGEVASAVHAATGLYRSCWLVQAVRHEVRMASKSRQLFETLQR